MTESMPIVKQARYAKGMALVICPSNGSGWRTRASFLCEKVNGRYSNREGGWIMSPRKMQKVLRAWTLGTIRERRLVNKECEVTA